MEKEKDLEKVADAAVKNETDPSKIIYLGLDFGTSHCALATSSGLRLSVASAVGWPKDFIAYNVVKKQIVFGDECVKNRTSLDIIYPLENGVIRFRRTGSGKKSTDGREAIAAVELLKHLLGLVEKAEDQKIFAVVGSPARAEITDKQAIIDAAEGLVDCILVVSEPFLVSYNLGILGFSVIVDVGAGTLDICRMSGTIPDETDQVTLEIAGNLIDRLFYELLKKKAPGIHITMNLVKRIKEEYAFVGDGPEIIDVEFYVNGKLTTINISNELRESCSLVIPEICNNVRDLIVSFDPEFMSALVRNIILTGGGSKIKGLDKVIEAELSELGPVKVTVADDPFFQGALGGLKFAQEIPFGEWKS